ncbi:MAG: M23 family metallopeptidase [Myxococcota bacterium]|nr:M23 family metallopeptidase [Myxococcota bacterium]
MAKEEGDLSVWEIFGLVSPESIKQGLRGLRGDSSTPKHLWDLSTFTILQPLTSIKTWLKIKRPDKRIPIYNFFNRTPISSQEGYSVRVTQVCDFQGGKHTYDSHQGTDFIIPVGTVVVAPAPGVVIRVEREFDRGGLCVMMLHDHGLITTCNHLGRSLVDVGQRIGRGFPIALAGASGLDFLTSFLLSPPHVHFNTWLDGTAIDPFAMPGESSLWLNVNDPKPHALPPLAHSNLEIAALFCEEAVAESIEGCLDPWLQRQLRAIAWLPERAASVIYQRNYRPSKFTSFKRLYCEGHTRRPHLDLPFRPEDVSGIHFN